MKNTVFLFIITLWSFGLYVHMAAQQEFHKLFSTNHAIVSSVKNKDFENLHVNELTRSLEKIPVLLSALTTTPDQSAYFGKQILKAFCIREFLLYNRPPIDLLNYSSMLFAKMRIFIQQVRLYQLVDDPDKNIVIADPLEHMINSLIILQNQEVDAAEGIAALNRLGADKTIIHVIKKKIKTNRNTGKQLCFTIIDSNQGLAHEEQYRVFVKKIKELIGLDRTMITAIEVLKLKYEVDLLLRDLVTTTDSKIKINLM